MICLLFGLLHWEMRYFMPKVMILDHEFEDVFALEKLLKSAGYDVCPLTGPYGILAKFDFEKPDILLFNPDMPNTDTDALLNTLRTAPSMQNMIIIIICEGDDPEPIIQYTRQMNLNGYYMKSAGFDGILDYLQRIYD